MLVLYSSIRPVRRSHLAKNQPSPITDLHQGTSPGRTKDGLVRGSWVVLGRGEGGGDTRSSKPYGLTGQASSTLVGGRTIFERDHCRMDSVQVPPPKLRRIQHKPHVSHAHTLRIQLSGNLIGQIRHAETRTRYRDRLLVPPEQPWPP